MTAGHTQSARRRVLIIGGDADAAESLCSMLTTRGYEAETAHNGEEGIALAKSILPDVILCDLLLPDMDGARVAAAIRGDVTLKRTTKLIALTRDGKVEEVERALGAGFNYHIVKPGESAQILRLLTL